MGHWCFHWRAVELMLIDRMDSGVCMLRMNNDAESSAEHPSEGHKEQQVFTFNMSCAGRRGVRLAIDEGKFHYVLLLPQITSHRMQCMTISGNVPNLKYAISGRPATSQLELDCQRNPQYFIEKMVLNTNQPTQTIGQQTTLYTVARVEVMLQELRNEVASIPACMEATLRKVLREEAEIREKIA
ncbi:hypothetical protein BD410DRAFT_806441 [Rickenella mellea]|uniref:Uncharacterized protein n=1 Tax=Rickenella mellea TaxID=50990 RepID=A0A4Y7PT34_9AGAM|nr:hypothetical protein BD410DRAFT_806441 [Rickenella mellea]